MIETIFTLAVLFLTLSLLAVGGGNSVLPELHQQSVKTNHWMTDSQFLDVFAITRATPGPSMLICSVVGYKAGLNYGVGFAIACSAVATFCFFLPSFILTHGVSRLYERFLKTRWHDPIQHGFEAVTLGLLFAASFILAESANHDAIGWIMTGTSALLVAFTKVNPILIMAVAGVLGYFGLVS